MQHVLLLVEDDDADAILIGRAIRKAQVSVRLQRVKDGDEAISWLRGQPTPLSRTAVVMFTSSARSADINRAYELGANSYLRKPEQHGDLVEAIGVFNEFWLARCALPEVAPAAVRDA